MEHADPEALLLIYQDSAQLVLFMTALLLPVMPVVITDVMGGFFVMGVRAAKPHLSLRVRAWAVLSMILCTTTVSVWYMGGLSSIFTVWYFAVPVPALVLLGAPAMWGTLAVVSGLLAATYGLQSMGALPMMPPPGSDLRLPLVTMLMMVGSILTIPTVFYFVLQRVLRRQRRRNEDLREIEAVLRHQRRQQDEFVASISHELRTPMNAILGFLQTMDTQQIAHRRNREMLDAMGHSAQHLMTVINDLLDFSQIQAGDLRITPRRMSLHTLLRDATVMFEVPLRERGIPLTLMMAPDLPDGIWGDADRLTQVIINLLGNAAKFTRKGEVALRATLVAPQRLRIEVQDTGCGIAAEQVASVFDRFSRLTDQTRREYGGTGLGLSISQHLVQIMGGEIGVSSRLGVGSVFWFELPVTEASQEERASDLQARPVPDALRRGRVLIVDDSFINRVVARQMLVKDWPSLDIVDADGGQAAVDEVTRGGVSLVLMDVIMPEVDGLEATRRIRSLVGAPPVIGLTADVTGGVYQACLVVGMVRVLTKPYTRADLLAAIATTMQEAEEVAT